MAGVSGPRSSMPMALGKENWAPSGFGPSAGQISSKAALVGQKGPVKAVVAKAAEVVVSPENCEAKREAEEDCWKCENTAASASGDGEEAAPVPGSGRTRLWKLDWILALKREDMHSTSYADVVDYIFEYRGRLLAQYEANGYIDVDDAEHDSWMQKVFSEEIGHEPPSSVPGLVLCSEYYANAEDDDDESEDDDDDESDEEEDDNESEEEDGEEEPITN